MHVPDHDLTKLAGPRLRAAKTFPHHQKSTSFYAASKFSTIRDGFHLKAYNAEAQSAIVAQLSVREESPDSMAFDESCGSLLSEPIGDGWLLSEPIRDSIASASQVPAQKLPANARMSNNLEDQQNNAGIHVHGRADGASTTVVILNQLLESKCSNQDSVFRKDELKKACVALEAPENWLINRHRPSEMKQRKERETDKLLRKTLEIVEPLEKMMRKQDEFRLPTKPRYHSTFNSTYSQRVAAARPRKLLPFDHKHTYPDTIQQPCREITHNISQNQKDNARAVDELLLSLLHPPDFYAAAQIGVTSYIPSKRYANSSNRFDTRRSAVRQETAVALRSRNLLSRMAELRSVPYLLEQAEAQLTWNKQQHIAEHGVDIVARNRVYSTLQVLQKPSRTPLLPSATDYKVYMANKRKEEQDAAQEDRMQRTGSRWQSRHNQRVIQARRDYVQSQWLLIVALAVRSNKWLTKFHKLRQKHVQNQMAKRLQRFWRHWSANKLSQQPRTESFLPLPSASFSKPIVVCAATKLQRIVRVWLKEKHHCKRRNDVALIITAWFEFQDVKFRRIILRFRKRVRKFQSMWRSWRAITAARIKLLLLAWAKVEREVKGLRGVGTPRTYLLPSDSLKPKSSRDRDKLGSQIKKDPTLLDTLQRITAEGPLKQQLERMRRHSRSGSVTHVPASATTTKPYSLRSLRTFSASLLSKDLNRIRSLGTTEDCRNRQLDHHSAEKFRLVVDDFYNTRKSLSINSLEPDKPLSSKTKHYRQFLHSSLLQLPPTSPLAPLSGKIPVQLKIKLLRKLLSDKRKMNSDARDRELGAWTAARKKMRTEVFRNSVLDELAAFQRIQAKYTTFLVLHSITETEMVHLMQQTHDEVASASE